MKKTHKKKKSQFKQEDHKFEASRGYIGKPCLKETNKQITKKKCLLSQGASRIIGNTDKATEIFKNVIINQNLQVLKSQNHGKNCKNTYTHTHTHTHIIIIS
jgi:hypothetical protein